MPPLEESLPFEELFFDCRTHEGKAGQICCVYNNTVELLNCPFKVEVLNALMTDGMAGRAVNMLTRIGKASSLEAYRICREMVADVLEMGSQYALNRPHKYAVQLYFFTSPEHFPDGDPHWSILFTIPEVADIRHIPQGKPCGLD